MIWSLSQAVSACRRVGEGEEGEGGGRREEEVEGGGERGGGRGEEVEGERTEISPPVGSLRRCQ